MASRGELASKLVDARNETMPAARSRLLEESVSEDVRYTPQGGPRAVGRTELSELIDQELRDPAHWVALDGKVVEFGDDLHFTWEVSRTGSDPIRQRVTAEVEGERIASISTRPADKPRRPFRRRAAGWAVDNPLPALAILGGAVYVLVRLPLAFFYNALGATPEEAGFTNQELLRQSAVVLGSLVAFAAAVTLLLWLLVAPLTRLTSVGHRLGLLARKRQQGLVHAAIAAAFAIPLVAYVAGVRLLDGLGFSPWVSLALAAALAYVAVLGCLYGVLGMNRLSDVVRAVEDSERRRGPRVEREQAAALFTYYAGLAMVFFAVYGLVDGIGVKDGGKSTGRLAPWRAQPATVAWKDDAPKLALNNECRHLRYLGEEDKRLLLYDSEADELIRVPSEVAAVKIDNAC